MHECKIVDLSFFSTAKYCYTSEVVIRATPQQIFEVFEDADAWPAWALPIKSVEWTSPKPFSVGTTRTVEMPGGLVCDEIFLAWEQNQRMCFCFTRFTLNSMESFAEDYQVTDLGNGQCKLQWVVAMQPKGIGKLFLPLLHPFMAWTGNKMVSAFRDYTEQRYRNT
jgi:hypothetical protein